MAPKILITGSAGYIGGSILADFIKGPTEAIKTAQIIAAVRSEENARLVARTGARVVQVDLDNQDSIESVIMENDIDVVIQTAAGFSPIQASNILRALGRRRQMSGREVFYIHPGVTNVFGTESGWTFGELKDTDPAFFEKERKTEAANPARETDIAVIDEAKKHGVTSFEVGVPLVYGKGTGEVKKLCANIPSHIRAAIAQKTVHKFDVEANQTAVHISDLVKLYRLLTDKILEKEHIPSGDQGYYFAFAHQTPWWSVMERLAKSMHARGLVTEPTARIWPSYEQAAEALGFPIQYIRPMAMSNCKIVAEKAFDIGWRPTWNEEAFLESIDDEVGFTLEHDRYRQSLFDTLLAEGRT